MRAQDIAATTLTRTDGAILDFSAALMDGHGFPIPDWKAVNAWADGAGVDIAAARNLARRAWLLHLRDATGGAMHVVETRNAMVLSSFDHRIALAAARYVSDVRGRIVQLLDGIGEFPAGEQSVMLVFDSREDYYRYVANYYPDDGEFAFSGGMFINAGCPHFVGEKNDLSVLEPVIAHEMTHNSVAHLSLPMWLDEGIAVNTESRLAFQPANHQDAIEEINKHHEFWSPERVQEFWSGQSFLRTDEGNELSYDMARHIVELLGRDWPSFTRFARAARREDGGVAAAREMLGLDLGQLAATAIGMEEQKAWSPRPESWVTIEERA
ncbi:MAG: hypothetical protein H7Y89_01985 [Steroidobacteraceae bacterium]|nr:hypothetical protein [Steroidobacteraceae bacterium]